MPAEPSHASAGVIALLSEQGRIARVRAAFGDQARFCASTADLLATSREKGAQLVIVSPAEISGDLSLTTTVAAIRASRQSAPVYIYGDRRTECLRQLMPLARAGARGLILLDVDDDVISLRRLIIRGTLATAIASITVALQQVVSPRHLPLFLFCLEHIADPPSASTFARQLSVSRRTLSAWARQAGARGIRSLTSKCRVLAAIEMLRQSDRSIEQVAHDLRFASSAHLHNTVRRYTGLRPREAATEACGLWGGRLFATTRATPSASRRKAPAPGGMARNT